MPSRPRWNAREGKLYWGKVLIRRVRHDAADPRTVLNVLEREGWPKERDNPFPLDEDRRQARFQNSAKKLNRGRLSRAIRFFMNGTGERICWRVVGKTGTSSRGG